MCKNEWSRWVLFFGILFLMPFLSKAQTNEKDLLSQISYDHPQKYTIGGIDVSGISYLDKSVVIMLSDLEKGQRIKIPGDDITTAIHNLWNQGLFDDVRIYATKIKGDSIFLNIYLREKPKLNKYSFTGIKKSEQDDIKDKINLTHGDVVSNHLIMRTENIIKNFYRDKGFLNAEVTIIQKPAGPRNNRNEFEDLIINVKKNKRVKIAQINIYGNHAFSDDKVRKAMKDTREKGYFNPLNPLGMVVVNSVADIVTLKPKKLKNEWVNYFTKNYRLQIFKSSKFIESKFQDDLNKIIAEYNAKGYRDAQIVKDSVYKIDKSDIGIDIYLKEGDKYYYRKITWVGNTIYSSKFLSAVLGIKPGDVYNKKLLETNLNYNDKGFDVSSLYMDNGYLFFSATPVETYVGNDSIDLQIRIHEGKQARINKVTVSGNTKTNDHVIIRELRTKPGQLFSRTAVIRSVRELANLKYFNAQNLKPDIKPNQANGTVDINYSVEETSADQIELSGGWGYGRVIGTIGLSFNNFSLRNFFNGKAWRPVPSGDGQKLSLRFQTYGAGYMSAGITFTEPWLGGRKPNALTVSYYYSIYSINGETTVTPDPEDTAYYYNGNQKFVSHAITIGLGKRLKWPDDYFTLYQAINIQLYNLENYASIFSVGDGNGRYNNLNYTITLGRNSVDQPIYPRSGSDISLSLELTPPYSLFSNKDYRTMSDAEKYKWIEYYKWKFKAYLYFELMPKMVLVTKARFGYLGTYNNDLGITPFERFYLGGDGLSGYNNYDGREVIGMRGYGNETITPDYYKNRNLGGTIYSRYTLELRYPISLAPTSTIYIEAFFEAGNAWAGTHDFDPFDLKRSAGIGARIYLPMFGLLGLDWGYGFDEIPGIPDANGSHFHFSMNGSLD
ncbi:BamA/TamA family outer membrane protein [Candidatus Sulfidibacterium hydrothermale]|uniref:BamA/OMP85 family outer membrane protein n=1 Tax=Candidatus Sulfidibacterium hydrothermale TaxID=2875962 RepID=UPI001F0ADDE9|nr:POTRA domain-containing protein [Candidatus Sulfidibacterium hydrothermale]UBM62069.1 BamA/TamA family outer membrane protein [Candidatus Sulfidibacterium hydrothermale]